MRSIEQAFEGTAYSTSLIEERTSPMYASASCESASAATALPVRLTRRGRAVVVMVVLALMVLGGFLLGQSSSQAAGHPAKVTVEAGETLWSVASRVAPNSDPRVEVAKIQAFNHLVTPSVEAGQQLLVPTG
jgi:LysM repeat protein